MSLAFFAPNRTVLLIADEALYIYATSAKGVRLVETVPWEVDNFLNNVVNVISKDCGRKPVLVLNDMVEQHYRKERVIKAGVGVLDKQGMIKRKLNVAFPNYPVKAAFQLKEKAPKSEAGPAADIYIFSAVPDTTQFTQAMAAAKDSLASIAAFCLLPIESSDMIKALSVKLAKEKKGRAKAKWAIFMGQHRNGGLRQIVTKNGELALTRMTPVTDDDSNAGAWAAEVHQEFKATMSYLSRFGYQPEDGLDVIMIANESAGEALEGLIEEECNYNALNSMQAARMLGVPLGRQDDARYADPLHIAWVGRKSKFILPMKAVQIDKVSKPRQTAMLASLLLFCAAAFLGYQLLDQFQKLSDVKSDIDGAKNRRAQLDVQYQREVKRKEDLGFDVRLVQSSIAVRDELDVVRIQALPLFKNLARALGNDGRIDEITIEKGESSLFDNVVNNDTAGVPLFEAKMRMTYPSTTDVDRGNQEVRDLRERIKRVLPEHKVKVTKFLKDYEYVEELVVETGNLDNQNVAQDFIAEISIVGPVPKVEQGGTL